MGPREVLISLATVLAARMLDYTCVIQICLNIENILFPLLILQLDDYQKPAAKARIHARTRKLTYLVSLEALDSPLLFLLPDDDEGASVFVESERHIYL